MMLASTASAADAAPPTAGDTKATEAKKDAGSSKPAASGPVLELVLRPDADADAGTDAAVRLVPTGPIPANTAFTVVIRGQNLGDGAFRVWQRQTGSCDDESGARGRQDVALFASDDGKELRGKLGALPSATPFCMAAEYRYVVPPKLWAAERRRMAELVVSRIDSAIAAEPKDGRCKTETLDASLREGARTVQSHAWRLADPQVLDWLPDYAPAMAERCAAREAAQAGFDAANLRFEPEVGKELRELMDANPEATLPTRTGKVAWKDLVSKYADVDLSKLAEHADATLLPKVTGKDAAARRATVRTQVVDLARQLEARKGLQATLDVLQKQLTERNDAMIQMVADALDGGAVSTSLP
ncbi:MAG: hypothetical protein ACK4YP_27920, partial [Myxococcota bacterium]